MTNSEKIVKNLRKGIAAAEESKGSLVTISLREAKKLLSMVLHEPRLLTIEEANEEEIVFIELKRQKELYTVIRDVTVRKEGSEEKEIIGWYSPTIQLNGVTVLADEEGFNTEVRYWSARPSDELREQTPWG